jgi:preprotein translocase subunit SecD
MPRTELIQYRWIDASGRAQSGRYIDPNTGQSYALSDTIVLDLAGIERAEVHSHPVGSDTGWDVVARLNSSAAAAFSAATANHIGEKIAVLIDDRIITTAQIESRLGSVVGVAFTLRKAAADSLAARINQAKAASSAPH